MASKTIVLTGASDGIGALAARQLVADGNTVVLVGRSRQKTEALAGELRAPYFVADFARLAEVRQLAADIARAHPVIDILVNNAGGIFGKREITVDGFEKNLQVNYLAPYLLTQLLLEPLKAAKGSVINVSSESTRRYGKLDIDDLNSENDFSDARAYANAKIDLILFTKTLQAQHGADGLTAVALHPGNLSSNFASDKTSSWSMIYNSPLKHVFLTKPKKGADNLLHFVNGRPGVDWTPGAYYHLTKPATAKQTAPQINDAALAVQLEERTRAMLGLVQPKTRQGNRS